MAANLPDCPTSLKTIAHYLKTAQEHESRDLVVAYWCRLYALQAGLKLSTKQPAETSLLVGIMEWLEEIKKLNLENEAITNDIVAQAYLENYAHKLFTYADQQDRSANFGKNVVKAFYTCGIIFDVLLTFGELSQEVVNNRKYAKWKAAYIHNCLKNGEVPVPGPIEGSIGDDANNDGSNANQYIKSQDTNSFLQDSNENNVRFVESAGPTDIHEQLPSPPKDAEEKNPGGFKPYTPLGETNVCEPDILSTDVKLTSDQMSKAQKYCKWASSALTYDDVKTAAENLQKALHLLQTGEEYHD